LSNAERFIGVAYSSRTPLKGHTYSSRTPLKGHTYSSRTPLKGHTFGNSLVTRIFSNVETIAHTYIDVHLVASGQEEAAAKRKLPI